MTESNATHLPRVAVIGAGPAGLMAAEVLSAGALQVDVFDAMPSSGRKFLMAGKGGLNITHAEPYEDFLTRYGARQDAIGPLLAAFSPAALRKWIHALGIETFVGSSGRVFPTEMKAAPLLRRWLHRLRASGVTFHMRHRWLGWDAGGALRFSTLEGERSIAADAVVLALGGGSWGRLGSTGAWVPLLEQRGVEVAPLKPANCGFDVGWSEHFSTRFAGQPVKTISASCIDVNGVNHQQQGEFVVTATGVEGSLIYALSAHLRESIAQQGGTVLQLDLAPGLTLQRLMDTLSQPRGSQSLASHLRRHAGITGVKAGLVREVATAAELQDPLQLARLIKALPLPLRAPRPLDEAISTAGGVRFEALDERLMVNRLPGVFCAGEMLDWEAPTGGYLLSACFASGRAAGAGARAWLAEQRPPA